MDREQAEKLIPILQGFLEGGELQERATGKNEWGKHSVSLFVSDGWEYRIKPKAREWWASPLELHKMKTDCGRHGCIHVREILE